MVRLLLFLFIFFQLFTVAAQEPVYRAHQVLDLGSGLKVEVLKCRGTGVDEECDVIYYKERRQSGKRMWQKKSILVAEVNAAADPGKLSPTSPLTYTLPIEEVRPTVKLDNTNKKEDQKIIMLVPTEQELKAKENLQRTLSHDEHTPANKKLLNVPGAESNLSQTDQLTSDEPVLKTVTFPALNKNEYPEYNTEGLLVKKLGVFIDCNTRCDMNYMRSEVTLVNFLLDQLAADIHILINQQNTGGGGKIIQIIFYGQHEFKNQIDTMRLRIPPNATEFERREEMIRGIKAGLVPFILKTSYGNYLNVGFNKVSEETLSPKTARPDWWNYWVFRLGTEGTFNVDQIYTSLRASGYINANRITDKFKIEFGANANYNNYKYTFDEDGVITKYNILNRNYHFEHSIVASIRSHWGIGYQTALSQNTFSNNKNRLFGKVALEYSIFPYKDVNTRFFTLSYGLDVRDNQYYDTTIYFKTKETLFGQSLQANLSFNQKWGTFSSRISFRNYFVNPKLNNLSASLNWNMRITGGLSFYVYAHGARVRDQVYLAKGEASEQDVLTRSRQLASEYNFDSGIGIDFRFGSKLNNFVNPRLRSL